MGNESDAHVHVFQVKGIFYDPISHPRNNIEKVDDRQAQAMFKTAAAMLGGLKKAFEHYEQGSEAAWR